MRIIGGKFGRRIIKPPRNMPVRPTTDLAKESLFNILRHKFDFDGKAALDLFAGTGSLSYEFASRGCASVLSVDLNYKCIQFIKETIRNFDMQNVQVVRADVFKFLKSTPMKFDIIFADPPYDLPRISEICPLVWEHGLLNEGGILVVEHPGTIDLSAQTGFLEHRNYGHVNFSLFQSKA
ncbi:MAG: 16S rRNA (guanine(966)-N(2))-methyltransferase RsmD [Bacteroidetes bacterium]|nr:16S rRNA (guanine(966)-N(2))-methyltransferase RsmD [Bacteroidota bacterium]